MAIRPAYSHIVRQILYMQYVLVDKLK